MSDYDKLTVVKLRDELVKRGLPKTGLKAALVQRLREADAQSDGGGTAPEQSETEPLSNDNAKEEEQTSQTAAAPAVRPDNASQRGSADPGDDRPDASAPAMEIDDDGSKGEKEEVGDAKPGNDGPEAPPEMLPNGQSPAQALEDLPMQNVNTATPAQSPPSPQRAQDNIAPADTTQPTQEPEAHPQLPTPAQTQSQPTDMTPMPDTQEVLEDSRKRKRRSQSPPPSSIDMQKRLKADDGKPHVELSEHDTSMEKVASQPPDDATSPEPDSVTVTIPLANGHSAGDENVTPTTNGVTGTSEAPALPSDNAVDAQSKSAESPVKPPPPSDTRFKSLFAAPPKPDHSSEPILHADSEDRTVSPAIHPATSALYIRELMRPLKPENVRDHLVALATPPEAPVDRSIITTFFLDSIRTHCLVEFASTSAASRVRSGLHDRVWPNERDRRPLYVDFVPEEKVKKWIDVEQNAPSGRGHPQKRWEVVYEDEENMIKAYLQEVGTNSGGPRAAQPAIADAGQGVKGAPSGPRVKGFEPRSEQARPDNGKGFQALDDLFKSTSAKPKLYFQPATKGIIDKRLDQLAEGRGGGRGDEMRRYTFEDDILVDRAPEYGTTGRGGFGSRGGFSRNYRARGGNYRADAYRGDSHTWRDRRSEY
ncbi:hypothetical protein ACLMJK_003076 [Lecanora helva]